MDLNHDAQYFLELQTKTGWGQMLASFARWCAPQAWQRALDIGTGPGLLPLLFARQGALAFGIDRDLEMLANPLHQDIAAADGASLPFPDSTFDLITASNILYLTPDPNPLLAEMVRIAAPGGQVCLLNPSEHMNVSAATRLADQRSLGGLERDTLLNYARRAEESFRWSEADLTALLAPFGLALTRTALRMGGGLVRYACAAKIVVS